MAISHSSRILSHFLVRGHSLKDLFLKDFGSFLKFILHGTRKVIRRAFLFKLLLEAASPGDCLFYVNGILT
jgi:hypothetical protein